MTERGLGKPHTPPIPAGLASVLAEAATNKSFRLALREGRARAVLEAGIVLTANEGAVLRAVSDAQLEAMIESMRPREMERRGFLRTTALGGTALLWQTGCERCDTRPMTKEGGMSPSEAKKWKEEREEGARLRGEWAPPKPREEPRCPRKIRIGPFQTRSGPDRTPGESDRERLQTYLERACQASNLTKQGSITYEFVVEPNGSVSSMTVVDNTLQDEDFDTIARRNIKKLVYFEQTDAARVQVTIHVE
jgi:hypothetical protein